LNASRFALANNMCEPCAVSESLSLPASVTQTLSGGADGA